MSERGSITPDSNPLLVKAIHEVETEPLAEGGSSSESRKLKWKVAAATVLESKRDERLSGELTLTDDRIRSPTLSSIAESNKNGTASGTLLDLLQRKRALDGADDLSVSQIDTQDVTSQALFSDENLEELIGISNPLLESKERDETTIEIIRFKCINNNVLVDMTPEMVTLSQLRGQIIANSKNIEEMGDKLEQKRIDSLASKGVSQKAKGGTEKSADGNYHCSLEINTYPLDVRYKVIDRSMLDEVEKRLNVEISCEGNLLNNSFFFLHFVGVSKNNVTVAKSEICHFMDNDCADEATETELRDLMRLLLSVGDVTRPIISVKRHCVLLGMYPIHCLVLSDEMILIETRNLSKTKNEILEKSAIQIKLAMMSCVSIDESVDPNDSLSTKTRAVKNAALSKHNHTPFDQICYESIFVTVGGIHRNALDALIMRAKELEGDYNSATYVSTKSQQEMQVVKLRLDSLLETVNAHAITLETLIDDDIKMAFMNLTTTKKHPRLYRMTVNNNGNLSQNDSRISDASHDIELLLYSYLLKYTKMSNESQQIRRHVRSVEDSQELQGLNVQTRVLVANTMITCLGTSIGFSGYITGAFGMNLNNNYTESIYFPDWSFPTVFVLTFLFIFIGTFGSMKLLQLSGVLPSESVFNSKDNKPFVKEANDKMYDIDDE